MGRPRKPTKQKLLEGDRKDRIPTDEPEPGLGDVSPPDWLGDGLDVWKVLAPDLIAQRVLTPWDAEAFAMVCQAVAHHRRAVQLVDQEGLVVTGAMGGPIKHPALQVIRDSAATFARLGGRFGLTPSDRARLSTGGSDDGTTGAARLLS